MPRFRLTRTIAAAAIAVAALFAVAPPAQAAVVDTDQVLLDGANADFGANWSSHLFGRPTDGGFVTWGDNVGRDNWVSVFGRVWADNFFGGGCARLTATYRNAALTTVTTDARTVCYSGYSAPASAFSDFRQSDSSIRSVRLCTAFRHPGSATFLTQACQTAYRD
jgi:hypothetical protein